MRDLMQLPEFLTLFSKLILFFLAVWILGHAITFFSEGRKVRKGPIDKALGKLRRYTDCIWDHLKEIRGLQDKGARLRKSKSAKAREVLVVQRHLLNEATLEVNDVMEKGPGDDFSGWLRAEGVDSGVIRHFGALQSSGSEGSEGENPYGLAFGFPAAIATPAGAAPTMSGTMEFLRDFSSSIEDGGTLPPFSGINDALVTTWAGCILTIFSVVFLVCSMSCSKKLNRERDNACQSIRRGLAGWEKVLGEWQRMHEKEDSSGGQDV